MTAAGSAQPRRRWLMWAGVLLVLGLLAWQGVAAWAAWHLLHPGRAPQGGAAADARDAAFERVSLVTADGVELAAWFTEPEGEPRGTVLVLHERHGRHSAARMRFARERGWAALALDFRGCGDSGDAPTGFGWDERLDVDAALVWLAEREAPAPLVGWGRSLGAAALVYAADPARDAPASPRVDALVLESLYRDVGTAFRNRVDQRLGVELGWPRGVARLALSPVPTFARWFSGVPLDTLRPIDVLPRLAGRPLLLAGGARDPLCTPAELRDLGAAVPSARTVSLDAAHEDFLRLDAWRGEVERFLADVAAR